MSCTFKKGQRAIILAGTTVFSTHPRWPKEGKVTKRSYMVTVAQAASSDRSDRSSTVVRWAGAGGYWKWCQAANVRPGPSDLELLARVAK